VSRHTRRHIRRDLRAWRRFRRDVFETWAGLITAEQYERAERLAPVIDEADLVISDLLQTLQEHA
jgi:hypothetical protein